MKRQAARRARRHQVPAGQAHLRRRAEARRSRRRDPAARRRGHRRAVRARRRRRARLLQGRGQRPAAASTPTAGSAPATWRASRRTAISSSSTAPRISSSRAANGSARSSFENHAMGCQRRRQCRGHRRAAPQVGRAAAARGRESQGRPTRPSEGILASPRQQAREVAAARTTWPLWTDPLTATGKISKLALREQFERLQASGLRRSFGGARQTVAELGDGTGERRELEAHQVCRPWPRARPGTARWRDEDRGRLAVDLGHATRDARRR